MCVLQKMNHKYGLNSNLTSLNSMINFIQTQKSPITEKTLQQQQGCKVPTEKTLLENINKDLNPLY